MALVLNGYTVRLENHETGETHDLAWSPKYGSMCSRIKYAFNKMYMDSMPEDDDSIHIMLIKILPENKFEEKRIYWKGMTTEIAVVYEAVKR